MKFFILLLFLYSSYFTKAFVPNDDNNYLILEEDQYRLIFDRTHRDSIQKIKNKIKTHISAMSQFKERSLEEKITIILFSPQTQISNAFATVIPSATIGLFPSSIIGQQLFMPHWMESVFEHELNHIHQMSHSRLPKIIRKILKFPSLLFFYLVNPYPNLFLPHFIIEGDAVLKESILKGQGGRLYNGDARALVFSQMKHYQHQISEFTKENLLRMKLTAHSGKEKYLHGGYLMAMLAEKYPHQTINSFFQINKKRPSQKLLKKIKSLNVPHKLTKDFQDAFSFKYWSFFIDDLAKSYFNHYLHQASLQKSSTEPILFDSFTCLPFNHSAEDIFFLTSKRKSLPILRTFNTKTKKWKTRKIDLPLGKVFKINSKYYSRSHEMTAPNTIHYSLFSEGFHNNTSFDSKYVEDLKNTNTLYIDTTNTLNGFKLYLNNKFYSNVHSNALFDHRGNIYYFKQKGLVRTLYKNKAPVFSYRGFYGRLLDIDSKGVVYFTGASPYGSSIYQYKDQSLLRSSSSDTIIQAKKINNKEFLACEVTPFGYAYKIIPIEIKREKPVLYQYNFKTRVVAQEFSIHPEKKHSKNTARTFSSNKKLSPELALTTQIKKTPILKRELNQTQTISFNKNSSLLKYKSYSSFKKFRFKGGNIVGLYGGLLSILGGNLIFSDYLLQNTLQVFYTGVFSHPFLLRENSFFSHNFSSGQVNYTNRIYRLIWEIGYLANVWSSESPSVYGQDKLMSEGQKDEKLKFDHTAYLALSYPFFQKGRWFSSIFSIKSFNFTKIQGLWRSYFHLGYSQKFPYQYAPNKAFNFKIFSDYKGSFSSKKLKGGFKAGASLDFTFHLWKEIFFFPALSYAQSFDPEKNPTQVFLYTKNWARNVNQESIYFKNHFDDTGDQHSFVFNDIYWFLFKSKYKAHSIGTVASGFKKAFSLSSNLFNLSYLTPLFRTRWIILKNLSSRSKKEVIDNFKQSSLDAKSLYQTPPEKALEMFNLQEENQMQIQTYTQWLEWTFGFESWFLLKEKMFVILGLAYGFKTPVQFWKRHKTSMKKKTNFVGIDLPAEYDKSNDFNSTIQFYIKLPL